VEQPTPLSSKSFNALSDLDSFSITHSLQNDMLVHSALKNLSSLYFFFYSGESETLSLHIEITFHHLSSGKEELLYGASTQVPPQKASYLPLVFNKVLPLTSENDLGTLKVEYFAKSTATRRFMLSPGQLLIRHDAVFQSSSEFSSPASTWTEPVSVKAEAQKNLLKRKYNGFPTMGSSFLPQGLLPAAPLLNPNPFETVGTVDQQLFMARALQQHQQHLAAATAATATENA
jgi:hypothetical protein